MEYFCKALLKYVCAVPNIRIRYILAPEVRVPLVGTLPVPRVSMTEDTISRDTSCPKGVHDRGCNVKLIVF